MAVDDFYSQVHNIVSSEWNIQELEGIDGKPFIFARFGDVNMELHTLGVGEIPVARVTANVAKHVPVSQALIERLNGLNASVPLTTLAMALEDGPPNTVRVFLSASVFADFLDRETLKTAVEATVWPANALLQQGFLTSYGGELPILVELRAMIEASQLLDESQREPALSGLIATANELESRVRAGDVGRL
jgi:hypothetical protein